MRLIGLLLVLIAFSQSALAREHARHHRHHHDAHHHRLMSEPVALADRTAWFGAQQFGSGAPSGTRVYSRRLRRAGAAAPGWNNATWSQPSFGAAQVAPAVAARAAASSQYDSMIARHAAANGLPEALVRRVIVRESRYNPSTVGRGGAMGMMQIKLATARGVGYTGSAAGLLDPETNLTYAVRYLAGAYQVAGGNADRAVSNYARGYYYTAKRQGTVTTASAAPLVPAGSYATYARADRQPRVANLYAEWSGGGWVARKARKHRR